MHYKERVVKGTVRSEHIVQIFDSAESVAQSVSEYLISAYRADQNLLIVAKPQHWESIEPALRSAGCDVAAGLECERILVLDAITTVRALCRDELPSRARFDDLIGRLTRRLGGRRGLCAYGEMVDVLAEEGNIRGAMLLEELWNGVTERTSLSLMCGYSSAHFVSGDGEETLSQICRLHSGVRATSEDPLAGWLLQKAGLPFESGLAGAGS